MTVNTTTITAGPYAGNDLATEFSFGFNLQLPNQIIVFTFDDESNKTELTLGTDYSVSINQDNGGTVVLNDPLQTGVTLFMRSNYEPTQQTDLESQGSFFPDVHEDALDKLTILILQLTDSLGRSLRIEDCSPVSGIPALSELSANGVLTVNEDGDAFEFRTFDDVVASSSSIDSINRQLAALINLQQDEDLEPVFVMRDLVRDGVRVNMSRYKLLGFHTVGDYGGGEYYYDSTCPVVNHNGVTVIDPNNNADLTNFNLEQQQQWITPASGVSLGCFRLVPGNGLRPEQAGSIGDYVFNGHTGTDNSVVLQNYVNVVAINGTEIKLSPGRIYLTDTLSFSPFTNDQYPAGTGRVSIVGEAMGIATGDIEPQGSGFAHKNGITGPVMDFTGNFTVTAPGGSGRGINLQRLIVIGGNASTDAVYIENCNGQVSLKDYIFRIRNGSSHGLTLKTSWEIQNENGLIRGDADPEDETLNDVWTGVGINILSDDSGGQNNMQIHQNINVARMGRGRQIGRRDETSGTFSPIKFIGGQCSNNQHEGELIGAGVYVFNSDSCQYEGNRLNGVRIDSEGGNDLPRGIKYTTPYFTNNGAAEDGSQSNYAVNVVDGQGVELDTPLFQNTGDGVFVDLLNGASDIKITRPIIRSVTSYGASSGTAFKLTSSNSDTSKVELISPRFNQNTNTQIDAPDNVIAKTMAGGVRVSTTTAGTINIARGGGDPTPYLNVLLDRPTNSLVANFANGRELQTLTVMFTNTNTSIQNNTNISFSSGTNYTPSSNESVVVFLRLNGRWVQIGGTD